MVRRLGLGKNNHLTYASLALNPRLVLKFEPVHLIPVDVKVQTLNFAVSDLCLHCSLRSVYILKVNMLVN